MDRRGLDQLFRLDGRVAIVTGGTRGIGRAIAEGFALAGAKVVVASRKPDACRETQAALEALGAEALGVPTHVDDLAELDRLVEAAVERFGAIDVLVNNAANALAQPFGEMTEAAFDKSIGVNLKGPVFLIQAALPHLESSDHASVINVSSAAAYLFSSFQHMYAGAKAALLAYTRALAADFAPRGIRVNAIAPGTVDTDMVRNNPPEMQDLMAKAALLRRAAHPDETLGLALYLASDASSFVTGATFNLDGGLVPR